MDAPLTHVGNYELGQPIGSYPEAKKYSWLENRFAINLVNGETHYHTPWRVDELGTSWTLVLGVFEGTVYKLSLRWGTESFDAMMAKLYEVVDYCRGQFGPKNNLIHGDAAVWGTGCGAVTVTGRRVMPGSRYLGQFSKLIAPAGALIGQRFYREGEWLVMVESFAEQFAPK